MRVTVLGPKPHIASSRYRSAVAARGLKKAGITVAEGGDLLIIGKHGWDESLLDGYKAVIFDVCDVHFNDSPYREHYERICARATAITCNTPVLQFILHKHTGRFAHVIEDPFERPEWKPTWGEGALWFGHPSNLSDLIRVIPDLPEGMKLGVISKSAEYIPPEMEPMIIPWSPSAMDKGLASCRYVIIPTGKSPAKSSNRLIESVRAGKFVIAEPLPAYHEFSEFMWVGNIAEGIAWADENREKCLERVKACQEYILPRYHPTAIGEKWVQVARKVYPWAASISSPS